MTEQPWSCDLRDCKKSNPSLEGPCTVFASLCRAGRISQLPEDPALISSVLEKIKHCSWEQQCCIQTKPGRRCLIQLPAGIKKAKGWLWLSCRTGKGQALPKDGPSSYQQYPLLEPQLRDASCKVPRISLLPIKPAQGSCLKSPDVLFAKFINGINCAGVGKENGDWRGCRKQYRL